MTLALDPDRLISSNDGWETYAGNVIGIHDYTQDAAVLSSRYASAESVSELFGTFGPELRTLTLDGFNLESRAIVLSRVRRYHARRGFT